MTLPFVYQVTKYDPADRDAQDRYQGAQDHLSNTQPVEDAYVATVEAFARECGVTELTVRNPEFHGDPADLSPLPETDPLALLFGVGAERFVDGTAVDLAGALTLVRLMLRGETWCRLERPDFAVHIGWDMYVYVSAAQPCRTSVALATRHGLFAEPIDASPYDIAAEPLADLRTVDDAFWADVEQLARQHGSVVVLALAAWATWHVMTPGAEPPRARPGAQVSVWPERGLPPRNPGTMREVAPGVVRWIPGPEPDGGGYADDMGDPALSGVVPGPDGTVTARWPPW